MSEKTQIVVEDEQQIEDAAQKALQIASSQKQQGFSVPTELISLPSQGKIYPKISPLHNLTEVEVRHLIAPDEDILTSRSLIRSGKMIDALLANCITNKTIRPEDMIAGDKNAIMVFLRVSGYTSDYDVTLQCPLCSEQNIKWTFDLSKLEMNVLELEPVSEGENRFEYTLPSGNVVQFKFLSSREEREITEAQESLKKKTNMVIDKGVTTRFKKQLLSVNGVEDQKTINMFVDSMRATDSRAFRKHLAEHDPDVIFKQDFTCSVCGGTKEVDVPITAEFFWPDTGV